jgi:hypothetical protein
MENGVPKMPEKCRPLLRKSSMARNYLSSLIGKDTVADATILETLRTYRQTMQAYRECYPYAPRDEQPVPSGQTPKKCADEYREYLQSYRQLFTGLERESEKEFLDHRRLYLRAKRNYEACLNAPEKPTIDLKGGKSDRDKPTKPISGPRILEVQIATKALSQTKPDPDTITDRLPVGTQRFYIFVHYDGFTPRNRVDILWYLRPAGGGAERLLFQENGGRLPKNSGGFSAPAQIEGGRWPSGTYRLVFRIDGRNSFEKRFTIGE